MSALLSIKGLRAGYGKVPVLHGIDLEVEEGEILGVLGHNGMGKTTLLKTIMGIVPTSAGVMDFDGEDLVASSASRRAQLGIGYVPQGRGIFPNLSVRDNLRMGVAAHYMDENDAIHQVLRDFPRLERLLDRDGGALSGGEQQLLALARCLISEPDLILLDEPTEGIQPSIIDEIVELLKTLNERTGVSIVLVEQSLDFITALSDRVLLIQKGAIAGEVSGSETSNPALIEEFTGLGAAGGATAHTGHSPKLPDKSPAKATASAVDADMPPLGQKPQSHQCSQEWK